MSTLHAPVSVEVRQSVAPGAVEVLAAWLLAWAAPDGPAAVVGGCAGAGCLHDITEPEVARSLAVALLSPAANGPLANPEFVKALPGSVLTVIQAKSITMSAR